MVVEASAVEDDDGGICLCDSEVAAEDLGVLDERGAGAEEEEGGVDDVADPTVREDDSRHVASYDAKGAVKP